MPTGCRQPPLNSCLRCAGDSLPDIAPKTRYGMHGHSLSLAPATVTISVELTIIYRWKNAAFTRKKRSRMNVVMKIKKL